MKKEAKLSSLIDKAVFDYKLIEKGDKILIGASGGKDSTALIKYFSERCRRPDSAFEYKALNIQSDFAADFPAGIVKLFEEWKYSLLTGINWLRSTLLQLTVCCNFCIFQKFYNI